MSKYTEALSSVYFTLHNRVKPKALGHCEDKNLELLEKLVERATPKKPDYWGDGYGDENWDCPCCGASFETDYDKYDYCPSCGQALDWSVEDDTEI